MTGRICLRRSSINCNLYTNRSKIGRGFIRLLSTSMYLGCRPSHLIRRFGPWKPTRLQTDEVRCKTEIEILGQIDFLAFVLQLSQRPKEYGIESFSNSPFQFAISYTGILSWNFVGYSGRAKGYQAVCRSTTRDLRSLWHQNRAYTCHSWTLRYLPFPSIFAKTLPTISRSCQRCGPGYTRFDDHVWFLVCFCYLDMAVARFLLQDRSTKSEKCGKSQNPYYLP